MDTARDSTSDIRELAHPIASAMGIDGIVAAARGRKLIALGEASHGTHEYYVTRAEITRRIVQEGGPAWIGVEGDWPDCWRIDRWVRNLAEPDADARALLRTFERWPTWMWANAEVAEFLDWLRAFNRERPPALHVGFYGLDVYSLWDSLDRVMRWLGEHAPEAVPAALQAWRCFAPFDEDPQRYAWNTRLVPATCEADVVTLLAEVRRHSFADGDAALDAVQNAAVAVQAERYYRAMVRTDRGSWNIRDSHMADTIERLQQHFGTGTRGIIWEHNTHVGDARATTMAASGMVNVGQLLRERYGSRNVLLVGFASHRGSVIAAAQWGEPEEVLPVPPAVRHSHEDLLHRALDEPSVLQLPRHSDRGWLGHPAGHRAIGVVYNPAQEAGNYVPTIMGGRYDALVWFEETNALVPLRHEAIPQDAEYETEPTGF
jgi:erythromycin esterase-like protein